MSRIRRQVALAAAAAAVLLLGAAGMALADGGPHQLAVNNGSSGINGDCASCHRAHTAAAADLLTATLPTLCTNCHNGTKATTDVVDGVQFSPTSGMPYNTGTTVGALRGGGFSYALIDSGNAARYAYSFGGNARFKGHVGVLNTGQKVTSTHSGTGTVWGNGSTGAGVGTVNLNCTSCHNPHGNGQYRILLLNPGEDWSAGAPTFEVSNAGGVMISEVGPITTSSAQTRNYTILPSADGLVGGIVGTATQGDYWRLKYDPTSSLTWLTASSADPMNEGWDGSSPVNVSEISTKTTLTSPITAGATTIHVQSGAGFPAAGDFTIRIDFELMLVTGGGGTTTWTVTRGYNNSAAVAHNTTSAVYSPLSNSSGLMTAWCIQCHTRYSGLPSLAIDPSTGLPDVFPSSVVAMDPNEPIFKFKHGTTNVGCQQCHVSHGSNAVLDANGSLGLEDPANVIPPTVPGAGTGSATSADSRLLKIDKTGTCNMCHDPTNTLTLPTYTGPQPTPGL